MKVLGIVCSPRRRGNTEVLVGEALAAAREFGAEVEMINLTGKNISPCDGCESCVKTRECHIKDDMQEIYAKLMESDGIILGSPVYFWGVTAQAKAMMDRTFVLLRDGRRLRNKVAGVVIVARRSGASEVYSALYNFFNLHRMVPAAGAIGYAEGEIKPEERGGGAIAYADGRGEVRRDERGIAEARALGKAVVRTIQGLHGLK